MATKKKAAPKKAVARKSHAYELTSKKFPELSGQGALIHAALLKKQPATSAQIASAIEGKLETKQTPKQVVSYYLGVWKSEGLVRVAKAPKAAKVSEPVAA